MKRNLLLEKQLTEAFAGHDKPKLEEMIREDSQDSFRWGEFRDVLNTLYFEQNSPALCEHDASLILNHLSKQALFYYLPKFLLQILRGELDEGEMCLSFDALILTQWSPNGMTFKNKTFDACVDEINQDQKDILALAFLFLSWDEEAETGPYGIASSILMDSN